MRTQRREALAVHGTGLAHLRPVYLGDDLFACQPIAAAIHQAGGNFILTGKPSSHKTIAEYLQGAELQEHRRTDCKRGKPTTTVYRWLNAVPLRACNRAIPVNWFSIEIRNAKGQRTYYNSFVTDLAVTPDTVAELAACGRARWKIENETFNVLKTKGPKLLEMLAIEGAIVTIDAMGASARSLGNPRQEGGLRSGTERQPGVIARRCRTLRR